MNKEMKFCDVIKMCPANGFDFMTQSGYLRLTTHDANKLTPDSIIYGHQFMEFWKTMQPYDSILYNNFFLQLKDYHCNGSRGC